MSEDTVILPSVAAKPPRVPLVPVLGIVALAASAAALVLYLQLADQKAAAASANAAHSESSARLALAERKVRTLEQELAARQAELDSMVKATLPVDVSFRVGEPGTGFIAHFENRSLSALKLIVQPRRPQTGEYGRFELDVEPQSSGDFAEKQGWAFRSGDTIAVSAGDFRSLSLQVP
jgi:hypothetical protein